MVLDVIFVVLMLLALIMGLKQGLVKSVWKIGAWALTGVVVYMAMTPAANFLHGTKMAGNIYDSIYESISSKTTISETGALSKPLSETASLPEWIVSGIEEGGANAVSAVNDGIENIAQNTARSITDILINVIAAVGLFIAVRLILAVIFAVVDGASKLPVVSGINSLLGGVFSMINMLLGIYLAAALVSLFADPALYEYINDTYIVKYLFNNNILMKLFMSI